MDLYLHEPAQISSYHRHFNLCERRLASHVFRLAVNISRERREMSETNDPIKGSLLEQLRIVIRDGIDYIHSTLRLLQARATELALSSVLFVLLIVLAVLLCLTAFVLISVAIGLWLTDQTGSAVWSLVIIGSFYILVAIICGGKALRWFRRLRS
jgi:hypothetical protein